MSTPDYCLFFVNSWSMCMQKSEWASWVQAVGSIFAILAAIGIAGWQRFEDHRRERANAHAAATVVGSGVAFMTSQIVGCLEAITKDWETLPHQEQAHMPVAQCREWLERLVLPSESQLLQLTPVMPDSAVAMTRGSACIKQVVQALRLLEGNAQLSPEDQFASARTLKIMLDIATKQFKSAQETLMNLLKD